MPEQKKKKPLSVGRSLADLNKHAENVKIAIKNADQCKQYCVSVNDVFKKANARYHDGDEENSYILFMRYFHILESIKKTYEYQKYKKQYDVILIPSNALKAIERAETLSNSLKQRYAQLLEDTNPPKIEKVGKTNANGHNTAKKFDDVTDGLKPNDVKKNAPKQTDLKNEKTKPGNPEEHHMINSLPDVPNFDSVLEAESESKVGPSIDPWITPQDLYQLLTKADPSSVLIIDTRPPVDYESSHIKHSGVINIQEDLLKPGANVNSIERRLPNNIWEVWISRKLKSHVVILDAETKRDDVRPDQPIRILKDAVYRHGSINSLETEPRLLDSGFDGWFIYYPSLCTDPFYKKPKSKLTTKIPDVPSLFSNLEYPKLPELADRSLNEGGIHQPSKKEPNQNKPGFNGTTAHDNMEPRLDRSMSETAAKIGRSSEFATDEEDILDRLRRQISSPHAPENSRGHAGGKNENNPSISEKGASADNFRQRQGSLDRSVASDLYLYLPNQDTKYTPDTIPKHPPPPAGRQSSTLPPSSSPDFKRRFGPTDSSESLILPPSPLSNRSGVSYANHRPGFGSSMSYSPHTMPHSPGMLPLPTASTSTPSLSNPDEIVHSNYQPLTFDRSKSLPHPPRPNPGTTGRTIDKDDTETVQVKQDQHGISRHYSKDQPGSFVNAPNGKLQNGPSSLPNDSRSPDMSPSKSKPTSPYPSSAGPNFHPTLDNAAQSRNMVSSRPGAGYITSPVPSMDSPVPSTVSPVPSMKASIPSMVTPVPSMGRPVPNSNIPQAHQNFTQPQPVQPPPRPVAGPGQSGAKPRHNTSEHLHHIPNANPTTTSNSIPGQTTLANQDLPHPTFSETSSAKPNQRPSTASSTIQTDSRSTEKPSHPQDPEIVTSPGLPNGWEKQIDERTGRVYFIDHLSKSTHWELPPDFYAVRHSKTSLKQKRKAPDIPGAKSQVPGTKDNLSPNDDRLPGANEEPKSSMKRSLSTPNLAEMAENQNNLQPQRPVIDRSSKPLQTNTQLVDRSTKPLSKTRLTSLSPVYGSKGRNLTGLKNLGNTCYMNSVIQALSNTNPLAMFFLTGAYMKDLNSNSMNRRPEEVAKELAFLVKVLWSGQYRSVSPCDFKAAIGRFATQFAGTKQQDAHEFLMFFMDGIHEDSNKVKRKTPMKEQNNDNIPESVGALNAWKDYTKNNNSIIVDLFQGQFRSTVACQTCSKKSVTFDVFSCLPLQLTSKSSCSLDDCIRAFTMPEKIGGNNSWKCSGCKTYREATKTIELWKLPPVIIVQLKRFSSDGIWHNKLQTNVNFSINDFNINRYSVGARPEMTSSYNLFAVINHYGSFESGHYTAYCRNQNKWYCYDDNVVRDIDVKSIKTSAAYLLFYTTMDFIF